MQCAGQVSARTQIKFRLKTQCCANSGKRYKIVFKSLNTNYNLCKVKWSRWVDGHSMPWTNLFNQSMKQAK